MYHLNDKEKQRLVEAIRAVYAIPFVDDIEDYIWEAIFTYVKDVRCTSFSVVSESKTIL